MKAHAFRFASEVVALAAALGVVGVSGFRYLSRPRDANRSPYRIAQWESYLSGAILAGDARAHVTIVEFADFQCPYCQEMAKALKAVASDNEGAVRIVFRNLPLSIHRYSRAAALAGACADAVGMFSPLHDGLFARQDSIGRTPWAVLAADAGIADTASFARCVRDSVFVARVVNDQHDAQRLGIHATPTLLIDGWNIGSNPENLRTWLDKELRERRRPQVR